MGGCTSPDNVNYNFFLLEMWYQAGDFQSQPTLTTCGTDGLVKIPSCMSLIVRFSYYGKFNAYSAIEFADLRSLCSWRCLLYSMLNWFSTTEILISRSAPARTRGRLSSTICHTSFITYIGPRFCCCGYCDDIDPLDWHLLSVETCQNSPFCSYSCIRDGGTVHIPCCFEC